MLAIAGYDGFGFFAEKRGILGPCNVYWDTEPIPDAAGTVTVSGNTVTGTGTSFTTVFNIAQGDVYVKINTTPNAKIFRVKSIASNTSMTIVDPITFEDANETIATATTFGLFRTINLGRTSEEGVMIKIEEKTKDILSAQSGETAINTFSTGTEATVEFTLLECSLEKLFYLSRGSIHVTRDTDSNIVASGLSHRLGRDFFKNSKRMTFIVLKDGVESTNPLDRLDLFNVHLLATIEKKMDATTVHTVKFTGKVYYSEKYKINGKEYFGAINPTAITWDP